MHNKRCFILTAKVNMKSVLYSIYNRCCVRNMLVLNLNGKMRKFIIGKNKGDSSK